MVKFKLIDLDERLFPQRMRDIFKSLVDTDASYPSKDTRDGFLKSIPSNYGYVFFWFGWLDEEALTKYYKNYVSKEKLKEIEEVREKEEGYFSLQDHIRDELFPIVYDHSDTIGSGFAEVYLAILNADFKDMSIEKVIPILKRQAKKLEKLNDFVKEQIKDIDIEIHYETMKFASSKASEEEREALKASYEDIFFEEELQNYKHIFRREGWEILLKIDFDGNDTLKEVVERVDKIISPIKSIINKMVRYENSFFPF